MNTRKPRRFPVDDNDASLKSAIFDLMLQKGLKGMTMDSVASELGISKRTLYEKFNSKQDMVAAVIDHVRLLRIAEINSICRSSSNVMETLLNIFKIHRRFMLSLNPDFFREMDAIYPQLREGFERHGETQRRIALEFFRKGVGEGVFRADVNYELMLVMQGVQMEALKRMEDLFPKGLTIADVYEHIYTSMLRSIASQSGLEILERVLKADKTNPTDTHS